MDFRFRTKIDLGESRRFCGILSSVRPGESARIHIPDGSFVPPLSMLLISSAAAAARDRGVQLSVADATSSYLAHMGLLSEIDVLFVQPLARRYESETYIAIKRISFEELRQAAIEERRSRVQEIIETHARQFAALLVQSHDAPELLHTLTFCFTEIMRNAYEHSGAATMSVCAQYWPSLDRVDLAVSDSGVGIRQSLTQNPRISVSSELEALEIAILPGVSGRQDNEAAVGMYAQENPFKNSGWGLYMTARLCQDGGQFTIISNDSALRYIRQNRSTVSIAFRGTAIGLSIQPSSIGNLQYSLGQYQDQGRALAQSYGGIIDASAASLGRRLLFE